MRATQLKISEEALYFNAKTIREQIDPKVRMMCVVKADAYGHGSVRAARMMQAAGADAFAVAIVEEAQELRKAGITLPVLILGGGSAESLREAVRADVSQTVYSEEMLDVLESEACAFGCIAKAHLKIDTGMSRIGAREPDAIEGILKYWKENCPHVEMEGVFTHFCVSESDPEFTAQQDACFCRAIEMAHAAGFRPIAHAAATGAMLDPAYQHDMVRAGIALYGTLAPALADRLQYAQTLSTKPVRIETIHTGDSVGYGRTFVAERDTRVMTIPVGYGDGYPRALSRRAEALVCGRRVPQIGNVCMDMLMLDVTDVPEATLDSEVVLMGAQGGERITPDELAAACGTIPYEIMLGFSPRIRREYAHYSPERLTKKKN